MGASVYKVNSRGVGVMDVEATVPAGKTYRLVSVSCGFNTAPTTSQNLTVTLDASAGPDYDVLLYSVDPAAGTTTDVFWQPDGDVYLQGGDAADVAYTNTDARAWAVQVTLAEVG